MNSVQVVLCVIGYIFMAMMAWEVCYRYFDWMFYDTKHLWAALFWPIWFPAFVVAYWSWRFAKLLLYVVEEVIGID